MDCVETWPDYTVEPITRQRGMRIGDYVVLEELGRGAMGQVFRALHPQLDRLVALKLIALPVIDEARHAAALRVLREGRALARLRHPNVVTVHDVGEADGHAYVAMELVEGSTLRDWAAMPRSRSERLATLVQAGRGLAAVHRAGLLHRDFKPDNVLVSTLGEVRVGDFGLARLIDRADDQATDPAVGHAGLASEVTVLRSVVPAGTLPYMAPEVIAGAQATVASDQFSFCVTAFECLYGRRPFDGDTAQALHAKIAAGQIWRVPAAVRLPARAHRLLVRGLSASPGDRHASLEALLDRLAPVWQRRLPWIVVLGSAAATAATVAAVMHHQAASATRLCDDSAAWTGTWDDARRAEIRGAFLRTGLPYAERAYGQVAGALDRYTATWSNLQRERCLVAAVAASRDTQYELACLRQRREDVALLAAKLAHADADVVPIAARLSLALRPSAHCQLDPEAVPRPALVDLPRAGAVQLQTLLASAVLAHDAGDLATAERLGREVIAGADTLDVPLATEARLLLGTVQRELHHEGDDEATLFNAAVAAESAGLYALAAEGWLGLAGATQDRPHGDGDRWLALAEVAVRKAGSPPDLVAVCTSGRAGELMRAGKFAGALALQAQASKLLAAQYGADDLRVATSNFRLATRLGMVGRFREAELLLRDVVAIRTRTLSPTHPDTLDAQETLGICLHRGGRPSEALPLLQSNLASREALLGANALALAGPLGNLAGALSALHRDDEALVLLQRAVALREAAYGADDPRVAVPLVNLGTVLLEMRRLTDALPVLRRARDMFELDGGVGALNGAQARLQIAEALSQLGRYDEAIAELAPVDHLPSEQYALIAAASLVARGRALLALGKRAAAEQMFERAAKLRDDGHKSPELRQQIADGLARTRRAPLAR